MNEIKKKSLWAFGKTKQSNKMVLWNEVAVQAREDSATLPFRPEERIFFKPLIETVTGDLLSGKIKGYAANGEQPAVFANSEKRAKLLRDGPCGISFRAGDLKDYIEKFEFTGKPYHENIFTTAKAAFMQAVDNAQDQSWNMALLPVIFTCNREDFAREVGRQAMPSYELH